MALTKENHLDRHRSLVAHLAFCLALAAFVIGLILMVIRLWAWDAILWIFRAEPSRRRSAVGRGIIVYGGRLLRVVCAILRVRLRFVFDGAPILEPVIILVNHQSTMDVAVLPFLRFVGVADIRPVAKSELANAPGIGWLARACGAAFVKRNGEKLDTDSVTKTACIAGVDGASVLLFPEGTRFTAPVPDSGFHRVLAPKRGGFSKLRLALPRYPVLSITLRWDPPLAEGGEGKTIFRGAALYGRTLTFSARVVPAMESANADWLQEEWKRKDVELSLAPG